MFPNFVSDIHTSWQSCRDVFALSRDCPHHDRSLSSLLTLSVRSMASAPFSPKRGLKSAGRLKNLQLERRELERSHDSWRSHEDWVENRKLLYIDTLHTQLAQLYISKKVWETFQKFSHGRELNQLTSQPSSRKLRNSRSLEQPLRFFWGRFFRDFFLLSFRRDFFLPRPFFLREALRVAWLFSLSGRPKTDFMSSSSSMINGSSYLKAHVRISKTSGLTHILAIKVKLLNMECYLCPELTLQLDAVFWTNFKVPELFR